MCLASRLRSTSRLPFLQGTSLEETSAVPTTLNIDYMDSFVSVNKSMISAKKVNLQLQKRNRVEGSKGMRKQLEPFQGCEQIKCAMLVM